MVITVYSEIRLTIRSGIRSSEVFRFIMCYLSDVTISGLALYDTLNIIYLDELISQRIQLSFIPQM